jgi:hypothetical protein
MPQNAEKKVVVPEKEFLSGKVVETFNAGGYTYVSLENDGKKAWFAIPGAEVSVGQNIEVRPGTQMGKFTSKSLNRTFESIVFSSGLVMDTSAPIPAISVAADVPSSLPSGHPPMDSKTQPNDNKGLKEQPRKDIPAISGKVIETMDSGGYTYVCLENGGKKTWVAVPTMKVSIGQELKLQTGAVMTNFKSTSLNRTFESVIFSAGEVPETK